MYSANHGATIPALRGWLDWLRGRELALLLVVGGAIRLWLVFTAAGINSDAYAFARTARQMAEHGLLSGMKGTFVWPFYPVNRWLPVYPFLGSLLIPFTGDALLSLRLVSAAAGTGLIWATHVIARELFDRRRVALLAAALVGLHPEFARASAAVYREVAAAFVLAGGRSSAAGAARWSCSAALPNLRTTTGRRPKQRASRRRN